MQEWKPPEKQKSPELVEGPDSLAVSVNLTEHSASKAAAGPIQGEETPPTALVNHEPQTEKNVAGEAASEPPPDLGDRYEILEFLGAGGMGTVWKVHDKSLDETFAIKVIRPEYMTDEKAVKRFEKEAKLACDLTHANIAAVFGPGQDAIGRPFIIMRYVEGQSLAEILAREGKLNPDRAMNIFQQVWDALTHSHMKGVIHRDIKPSNIIITETEAGADLVQLVDFGIARSLYEELSKTQALTRAVEVFGSPRYMSPEQLLGQEVGPESDFYSLGCVLYEMLTGAPPFTDENPVRLVMEQINNEPDLSLIPPKIKPSLLCCLNKNCEQRKFLIELLARTPEKAPSPFSTQAQNIAPFILALAPITILTISSVLLLDKLALQQTALPTLLMSVSAYIAIGLINKSQGTQSKAYAKAEYAAFLGFIITYLLFFNAGISSTVPMPLLAIPALILAVILVQSNSLESKFHNFVNRKRTMESQIKAFNLTNKLGYPIIFLTFTMAFSLFLLFFAFLLLVCWSDSSTLYKFAIPLSFPFTTVVLGYLGFEFHKKWPSDFQETKLLIYRSTMAFTCAVILWLCIPLALSVVYYQPGAIQAIRLAHMSYDLKKTIKNDLMADSLNYPHTFSGDCARLSTIYQLGAKGAELEFKKRLCDQIIKNNSYSRKNIKATACLLLASSLSGKEKADALNKAIDFLESKDSPNKNDYRTNFWISCLGGPITPIQIIALEESIKAGEKELARRALTLLERNGVSGSKEIGELHKLKEQFLMM